MVFPVTLTIPHRRPWLGITDHAHPLMAVIVGGNVPSQIQKLALLTPSIQSQVQSWKKFVSWAPWLQISTWWCFNSTNNAGACICECRHSHTYHSYVHFHFSSPESQFWSQGLLEDEWSRRTHVRLMLHDMLVKVGGNQVWRYVLLSGRRE